MKLLVAVKVVPEPGALRFQAGLNRIVREGVTSMVNPLDRLALELALAERSRTGGQVVALTMGPPEIEPVLHEIADLGADRVIHLCDPCLAGADTLATSRALARVMGLEQADLLVCGRSAMDGGTAQTPAQTAEIAGVPFAGSVIGMTVADGALEVIEETGEGTRRRRVPTPAVISVEAGCVTGAGCPTGEAGPSSSPGVIERWDAERLGGDPAGYGIRGSRTYVQKVEETTVKRSGREVGIDEALRIVAGRMAAAAQQIADPPAPPAGDHDRDLWVVAECRGEDLHPTSLEGLACARAVSSELGAQVVSVLLSDRPGSVPARLLGAGADRVMVGTAPQLMGQPAELMAAALTPLVDRYKPLAVIAPWSFEGRHYLARVAARLQLGLTGDFVGLDTSPHPAGGDRTDLVWLKPAWAGSALARVVARTVPALGTLRPGACRALAQHPGRAGAVEDIDLDHDALSAAVHRFGADCGPVEGRLEVPGDAVNRVDSAEVVLCVGATVDPEMADRLRREADHRGWGFGGTPGAVGRRLVPSRGEISLVKRSISPPIFVGIELDGPEELDPVRGAGLVLSVGAGIPAALAARSDLAVTASPEALCAALEGARTLTAPACT